MADLHYLRFRVHLHATEDPETVREALRFVTGDAEVTVEETLEGYHGNPIVVLGSSLESSADVRRFLARLTEGTERVTTLLAELERRVDDDCSFYLRFSKQEAAQGRLVLAQDDDVIRVRGKVAAYPAKRSNALAVLRSLLGSAPSP